MGGDILKMWHLLPLSIPRVCRLFLVWSLLTSCHCWQKLKTHIHMNEEVMWPDNTTYTTDIRLKKMQYMLTSFAGPKLSLPLAHFVLQHQLNFSIRAKFYSPAARHYDDGGWVLHKHSANQLVFALGSDWSIGNKTTIITYVLLTVLLVITVSVSLPNEPLL